MTASTQSRADDEDVGGRRVDDDQRAVERLEDPILVGVLRAHHGHGAHPACPLKT